MADPDTFWTAEALIQRNQALLARAASARTTSQRLILRTRLAWIDRCLRPSTPPAWRLAMARWALGTGGKPRLGGGERAGPLNRGRRHNVRERKSSVPYKAGEARNGRPDIGPMPVNQPGDVRFVFAPRRTERQRIPTRLCSKTAVGGARVGR
jgi:hypothetical protein